jgi:hypothetical protein
LTFELTPALPGTWHRGQNKDIVWMQFLDPKGEAEFTIKRKRHCLNVEYLVHKISPELGRDLIVPYSLQDYVGEEMFSCDGTGFLLEDSRGGTIFSTGVNDFDNDYSVHLEALARITDVFCFVVIETEYIIPIDQTLKTLWKQLLVKDVDWPAMQASFQ